MHGIVKKNTALTAYYLGICNQVPVPYTRTFDHESCWNTHKYLSLKLSFDRTHCSTSLQELLTYKLEQNECNVQYVFNEYNFM